MSIRLSQEKLNRHALTWRTISIHYNVSLVIENIKSNRAKEEKTQVYS